MPARLPHRVTPGLAAVSASRQVRRVGRPQRVDISDEQQVGPDLGRVGRDAPAGGAAPAGTPRRWPSAGTGRCRRRGALGRRPRSGATQGSTTDSGTTLRRSTVIVASAIRSGSPWANGASTGASTRSPITSSSTVSSLRAEVRRAGQHADRVGAVGDRVRPALAGHEARARRARGGTRQAIRSPHSSSLAAGTRPCWLSRSMHSASTSTEKVRRKTVSVPCSPRPTVRPAAMPSPRPTMQVVVDARGRSRWRAWGRPGRRACGGRGSRASWSARWSARPAAGRRAPRGRRPSPGSSRPESCGPSCHVARQRRGHERVWAAGYGPLAWRVPSLTDLVRSHTDLDDEDVKWLQLLMADWQIIADLSFADLVLWLPDREGKGFWAAGQMRPTTGPTALRRRRAGHVRPGRAPPAARRGVRAGPAGARGRPRVARRRAGAGGVDPGTPRGPGDRGGRAQHQPARRPHAQPARAVLPPDRGRPDPDDRAGHFPNPGQRSDHADSPRVGDGFLRVDADGRVTYASPNALSVYRRLGHTGDLTGLELADGDPRAGAAAAPHRRGDAERGAAGPGAPRHRGRHRRRGAHRPRDPAAPGRRAHRRAGAAARRDRPAPPRPRAGDQGSHHPRDPPPGEEQPADRRGAAAAAGPADREPRRQGGARGGGPPGRLDRDRARDAQPVTRGAGRLRRDRRPAGPDGHRGERAGGAGPGPAYGLLRGACRRRRPPRWRWCSPRCSRTPSSTATTPTARRRA